ncbi:S-phase kinase-associated protein 1-like [Trichogramma pretiosum]|uniref:S-phase kinase-associated protein 1-like n=1 Tax=Trichogramma pretiosum TaxID=7493 RepID=UPI0006C98B91|nr:S-phase kinase-associated protein 1-like [Trichogramma pretiosum]
MKIVHLESSDEVIFDLDLSIAKRSGLIKTMIEHLGEDNLNENLPLSKIKSNILGMVIEFVMHHKDSPIPDNAKEVEMTEWDKNFLKVDMETLVDLINAANFLDMKDLLGLACIQMRSLLTGTPENVQINLSKLTI